MINNVFIRPPHLPLIAPSILAADFGRLGEEAADVERAGADLIHVDVMDGHFVPNLTMGPDVALALARTCQLMQDVHLMVTDPRDFIKPFVDAGAGNITFHIEATGLKSFGAVEVIKSIHDHGITAGISLNPETPVEMLESVLSVVDVVLVMSVHPGFTGQNFITQSLEKLRWLRHRLGPRQRLSIDGGIGLRTAHEALDAGADVLVAGSSVFHSEDRVSAIRMLRGDYPR